MDILESTRRYERWLGSHVKLVPPDLDTKHGEMTNQLFPFFRATFYRWAQLFPELCPALFKAPSITAIGDLHVENFGTWRDAEGRLAWGVNDFDESYPMPYLVDPIRLAASALIAIEDCQIKAKPKQAVLAIFDGYRDTLTKGGQPIVLAEQHRDLAALVRLKDPEKFWRNLNKLKDDGEAVPNKVQRAVETVLPADKVTLRYVHRVGGLGSLGRRRFAGVGVWRGAFIAREAKEMAPSACVFAGWGRRTALYSEELHRDSVRCPDPFLRFAGSWVVRRLAPDSSRIELNALGRVKDELLLLYNMGRETGNVHLATARPKQLLADLDARKPSQLLKGTVEMVKAVHVDWDDWRSAHPQPR